MKNYNIDDSLLVEFDQKQIDKKLNKLNRYLCILYTNYQFCINEYYDCLITILNMLNNYFINYGEFCDMKIFGKNLKKIRENLITKIAFVNNDVLNNLYSFARKKPSLLKGVFDFENFLISFSKKEINRLGSINENINLDEFQLFDDKYNKSVSTKTKQKGKEKRKLKELIPEEFTLIKSLFSFCKKNVSEVLIN